MDNVQSLDLIYISFFRLQVKTWPLSYANTMIIFQVIFKSVCLGVGYVAYREGCTFVDTFT